MAGENGPARSSVEGQGPSTIVRCWDHKVRNRSPKRQSNTGFSSTSSASADRNLPNALSSDFTTMEESAPAPKITALILSYNSAPALRRCLAALENSHGREQLQIIVVDSGSVDESPTLDREFEGVTIMRLPRNFGATKALNIGMRNAAGDYVLILEPEVIVEPSTAMALAARMDADESIAAVCPLLIDEAGQPRTTVRRLPSARR